MKNLKKYKPFVSHIALLDFRPTPPVVGLFPNKNHLNKGMSIDMILKVNLIRPNGYTQTYQQRSVFLTTKKRQKTKCRWTFTFPSKVYAQLVIDDQHQSMNG